MPRNVEENIYVTISLARDSPAWQRLQREARELDISVPHLIKVLLADRADGPRWSRQTPVVPARNAISAKAIGDPPRCACARTSSCGRFFQASNRGGGRGELLGRLAHLGVMCNVDGAYGRC